LASDRAWSIEALHLWTIESTRFSRVALESFIAKCLGPEASAVMKGRLISVSRTFESSLFAFSAAPEVSGPPFYRFLNLFLFFFKSVCDVIDYGFIHIRSAQLRIA
jgi:hypothetical protein